MEINKIKTQKIDIKEYKKSLNSERHNQIFPKRENFIFLRDDFMGSPYDPKSFEYTLNGKTLDKILNEIVKKSKEIYVFNYRKINILNSLDNESTKGFFLKTNEDYILEFKKTYFFNKKEKGIRYILLNDGSVLNGLKLPKGEPLYQTSLEIWKNYWTSKEDLKKEDNQPSNMEYKKVSKNIFVKDSWKTTDFLFFISKPAKKEKQESPLEINFSKNNFWKKEEFPFTDSNTPFSWGLLYKKPVEECLNFFIRYSKK